MSLTPSSHPSPSASLSNYYGDVDFSSLELQSLQFFHFKTVPSVCGFFDSSFWRRLLLQMSHEEPSLRCAMMAIGSAQRNNERVGYRSLDLEDTSPRLDHDAFTLHQYTKAINLVQKRLSTGNQNRMVSLVACILFVCLELLRGQRRPALAHLRCGISMLSSAETSLDAYRTILSPKGLNPKEMIDNDIAPIIARLSLLQTLYRQPRTDLFVGTLNVNVPEHNKEPEKPFATLKDARIANTNMGNSTLRFCHMVLAELFPDLESLEVFRKALLRRLQNWSDAFEGYLSSDFVERGQLLTKDERGAAQLRVQHRMAVSWARFICCPLDEMESDKVHPDFQFIVEATERIMEATERECPEEGGIGGFNLDNGIIPPLVYAGIKCRDPILRRRAVALLYRSPWRREGLWDAVTCAKLIEAHINVEEEFIDPTTGEWPAAHARIMDMELHLRDPKNPRRQLITLRLPPIEEGHVAYFRKEYLYFDEVNPGVSADMFMPGMIRQSSMLTDSRFTPASSSYGSASPHPTQHRPGGALTMLGGMGGETSSYDLTSADEPDERLTGIDTTTMRSYSNIGFTPDWLDGSVSCDAPNAELASTPFGQSLYTIGTVR